MLGLSRRWLLVVAGVGTLKLLLIFIVPVCCDFVNWVYLSQGIFADLIGGRLPSVAQTGPYTGLGLVLVPFFALWAFLPIQHPSLSTFIGTKYFFVPSVEGYLLVFLMKLPILVFDVLTGLLTYEVVRRMTGSSETGGKAFLFWYLNPFNAYLMNSWSSPGTFDVVPTAILLLAVLCGSGNRWFRAGLCLSIAGIIRLFPVLLLPFFLAYTVRESPRATGKMLLGFVMPLAVALLTQASAMGGSMEAALSAVVAIPLRSPYLMDFYGLPITTFLVLTPFLFLVQLYVVRRYWHNGEAPLANLILASLLVLLLSSYHHPYHFIWVVPFLTAYFVTRHDALALFPLLFFFAFLSSEGFDATNSSIVLLQPLLAGVFYGLKGSYLLKINIEASHLRV